MMTDEPQQTLSHAVERGFSSQVMYVPNRNHEMIPVFELGRRGLASLKTSHHALDFVLRSHDCSFTNKKPRRTEIRSASVKFSLARLLLSRCLIGLNGQPRLVTCSRILVHDTLLDRLVDHRNGLRQYLLNLISLARVERRAHLLDVGPNLGSMTTINHAPLLTLPNALLC